MQQVVLVKVSNGSISFTIFFFLTFFLKLFETRIKKLICFTSLFQKLKKKPTTIWKNKSEYIILNQDFHKKKKNP